MPTILMIRGKLWDVGQSVARNMSIFSRRNSLTLVAATLILAILAGCGGGSNGAPVQIAIDWAARSPMLLKHAVKLFRLLIILRQVGVK